MLTHQQPQMLSNGTAAGVTLLNTELSPDLEPNDAKKVHFPKVLFDLLIKSPLPVPLHL